MKSLVNPAWTRLIIPSVAFALSAAASLAVAAEAPSTTDASRKQAKFVHRTYQMTLGAEARCAHEALTASGEFKTELQRFQQKYPVLMERLKSSPHYPEAVARFAPMAKFNPATDPVEKINGECLYVASLMRSMVDTEEGQRSAKEVEAVLSGMTSHNPRP